MSAILVTGIKSVPPPSVTFFKVSSLFFTFTAITGVYCPCGFGHLLFICFNRMNAIVFHAWHGVFLYLPVENLLVECFCPRQVVRRNLEMYYLIRASHLSFFCFKHFRQPFLRKFRLIVVRWV